MRITSFSRPQVTNLEVDYLISKEADKQQGPKTTSGGGLMEKYKVKERLGKLGKQIAKMSVEQVCAFTLICNRSKMVNYCSVCVTVVL
tara:strand:- start:1 stop:264 length:264 start_codon:yes stop_codon:yes gene_type:complete